MRELVPAGSAVFVDLGSGMRAEYQPRQRRKAASAIKVGLVAEVLRQADTGWISLDDPYTVRRDDLVGGTGSLQFQLGATVPLREVVRLTIVQSDNVAANHLLELVGRARVNAALRVHGFSQSVFLRRFGDTIARQRGLENWTSAADLAGMLRHARAGTLSNSKQVSGQIMELLAERGAVDPDWIKLGLPAEARLAHINGTLTDVRNDAGIVTFAGARKYILVVCLDGTDASAEQQIAQLARRVHALVRS